MILALLVEQGIGLVLVGVFVGAVISDLTRPGPKTRRSERSEKE